jgi:chitinase
MPYVDMTADRSGHTLTGYSKDTGITAFALAFVGVKKGSTKFTWAGYEAYPAPDHFLSEINDFKKNGGVPVLSFGGSAAIVPEHWITDPDALLKGYESVIDGYQVRHINFDIEANDSFKSVRERNAVLVSGLAKKYADLRISYSLEVDKEELRLTDFALHLLTGLHQAKIVPALVNVLIEYFPKDPWKSARTSLEAAHKSLVDTFGITSEDAWLRIGACPMFSNEGGNTWSLDDQKSLRKFAEDNNIGCLSGWNTNKDASSYPYEKIQKGYQPKAK